MASRFDVVFAFKEKFGDISAANTIANLRSYPVLWSFISKEDNYLRIANILDHQSNNWNIRNILDSIIELYEKEDRSEIQGELEDIVLSIHSIKEELFHTDWNDLFQKGCNLTGEKIRNIEKWVTIHSYFYASDEKQEAIENMLCAGSDECKKILAFFIKNHVIKDQFEFLRRNTKIFYKYPEKVLEIADSLRKNGSSQLGITLIKDYFTLLDLNEKQSVISEKQSVENRLADIQRLISLSALAKAISDSKREKYFNSIVQKMIQEQAQNQIKREDPDFRLLEEARILKDSDVESARKYCLQWFRKIRCENNNNALNTISPEKTMEVLSIFESLSLYFEEIFLIEMILAERGPLADLEKKIGNLCARLGDQSRVIRYLHPLFGENILSREEKLRLIEAFVYHNDWESAEKVFRSVNRLSIRDELFGILCAQFSESDFDIKKKVNELESSYGKQPAIKVLKDVFERSITDSLVFTNIPETEKNLLLEIIYNHLAKKNHSELLSFLASIKDISLLSKYLYTKHFSDLLPDNETEALLTNFFINGEFSNIKIFENLIKTISNLGLDNLLEKLIQKNGDRWPLSKEILKKRITILLNDREYEQADKLLQQLIEFYPIDDESLKLFGVSCSRTTLLDLPYSAENRKITSNVQSKYRDLLKELKTNEISIENQLLKIQILSDNKKNDFLALAANTNNKKARNSWRILFALGSYFFSEKQFDKAIFYLTESRKFYSENQTALIMLIESLNYLKLFDEATNLVKKEIKNKDTISIHVMRKFVDVLYQNDTFLNFLSKEIENDPQDLTLSISLAKGLILRGLEDEALEKMNQIESVMLPTNPLIFELINLYRMAGRLDSSQRVLEYFLSNAPGLDDREVMLTARMFYDLQLYEKALNILSLIDDETINIEFVRAALFYKLNDFDKAFKSIADAVRCKNKKNITSVIKKSELPESWVETNIEIIEKALIHSLKTYVKKDFDNILTYLLSIKNKDKKLTMFLCNISEITGHFEILNNIEANYQLEKEIVNHQVQVSKISRALKNDHAVEAASIFAELDCEENKDSLLDVQKNRLQNKQNQDNGLKNKFISKYENLLTGRNKQTNIDAVNLDILAYKINLAEGLYEIGEFQRAYDLMKSIIHIVGFTKRILDDYQEIILNVFDQNSIYEKLKIKNHKYNFGEEDKKIFKDFLAVTQKIESNEMEDSNGILEKIRNYFNDSTDLFIQEQIPVKLGNPFRDAVYGIEKKPAESIKIFKNLLIKNTDDPRYLFALGLAYKQSGNFSSSYASINLALEIWPDEFEWHGIASELCEKLGDNLNAMRHQKMAENYFNTDQNEGDDHNSLQALQMINQYLEKDCEIPNRHLPKLIEHARNRIRWGDFETAGRIIMRAREVNPDNLELNLMAGDVFIAKKEYLSARDVIVAVQKTHPNDERVIKLLIDSYIKCGEAAEASKILQKAFLRDDLKQSNLILSKAQLIEEQEGTEKACEYIRDQLNKNLTIPVMINAVKFLIDHNKVNLANEWLDILLAQNSNNPRVLMLAGKISSLQGDLDRAIEFYDRIIISNPFIADAYISCAELYDTKREYDFAQKVLEEGVKNNPTEFSLLKYSGKYFLKIGKNEFAKKCLQTAYRINHNDNETRELINIFRDT